MNIHNFIQRMIHYYDMNIENTQFIKSKHKSLHITIADKTRLDMWQAEVNEHTYNSKQKWLKKDARQINIPSMYRRKGVSILIVKLINKTI